MCNNSHVIGLPALAVASRPALPFNVSTTWRSLLEHMEGRPYSLWRQSSSFVVLMIGFIEPKRTKKFGALAPFGRNLKKHNVHIYMSGNTTDHSSISTTYKMNHT